MNYELRITKLLILGFMMYAFSFIHPVVSPVFAHVLLTDKSIGAVVHINPDDDPIAGQSSDFFFEFKDKDNRFDPLACDCKYQIKQGDKIISQGDLFSGGNDPSLENASFNVIFPEVGIYSLTLTGNPINPGQFSNFVLTDSIRVERSSTVNSSTSTQSTNFFTDHWIHFVVFGIGLVIFLVLLFFKSKKIPE